MKDVLIYTMDVKKHGEGRDIYDYQNMVHLAIWASSAGNNKTNYRYELSLNPGFKSGMIKGVSNKRSAMEVVTRILNKEAQ